LGRIGGAAAERLLVHALTATPSELRCHAAVALGSGGFFDRLPDLVRRLEAAARDDEIEAAEEVETLVSAIVGLAECSGAAEVGIDVQLVELLSSRLSDAMEPVRLAIARVLARLGREQDEDVIRYLLKDESPAVRRAAVEALGRFEFDQVREALRLALGDEASAVRIAAAHVLGELDTPEAMTELARLLEDEDPRVVAVAVRSSGRLWRSSDEISEVVYGVIARALEGDAIVALAGLDALMEFSEPAAGELAVRALQRPESEVVRSAVACVGAHGEPSCLVALRPLVSHPDWSVRAEAVQVLADRGDRRSLPILLRRLEFEDDPFVREAVLRATRRLDE
jgi:HEAT repeat protein